VRRGERPSGHGGDLAAARSSPRGQDFDTIHRLIEQSLATVEGWESQPPDALDDAARGLEAKIASERQNSEVWWGVRCRELEAVLREDQDAGMSELARSFADALVAGEHEMCRRIATHAWPTAADTGATIEVLRRLGDAAEVYGLALIPPLLGRPARLTWPPGAEALALDPRRARRRCWFSPGECCSRPGRPRSRRSSASHGRAASTPGSAPCTLPW
jgi:hypothetical protein